MTRSRGMRWVTGSAVAVVMAGCAVGAAAASAGGPAATARTASRGCYPKGSTTIAQDKAGRFYSSGGSPSDTRWYVCAFNQGTSRKLGYTAIPYEWVPSDAKVSGRDVAFFVVFTHGPGASVRVIDMLTGHSTFSGSGGFSAGSLALKADGSVAWIASVPGPAGSRSWDVRRHDSTGTATVDSGPQIDPGSLAAGGSWLYWTNAGSPRSAPFH